MTEHSRCTSHLTYHASPSKQWYKSLNSQVKWAFTVSRCEYSWACSLIMVGNHAKEGLLACVTEPIIMRWCIPTINIPLQPQNGTVTFVSSSDMWIVDSHAGFYLSVYVFTGWTCHGNSLAFSSMENFSGSTFVTRHPFSQQILMATMAIKSACSFVVVN